VSALERVVSALEERGLRTRASGGSVQAQCPAHDDGMPSLSLRSTADAVLVHCHAGCAVDDVLAELGMTKRDLFDEPRTEYRYQDAGGRLTRTVQRLYGEDGKKTFRQQVADKAALPLYRLPEVTAAVAAGRTVYVVEGEKDVHALESIGVTATCNAMGAGKWRPEFAQRFRGARVIVVADRDEPGRKHAAQVAASLEGVAGEVRVVEAAAGKDAADHVAAGYGPGDFTAVEAQPVGRRLVLTSAADIEPEPVVWAWEEPDPHGLAPNGGRIPLGSLSVAAGREGTGKSSFGIWMAAHITCGTLPGQLFGKPHAVIYAAVEDSWKHTLVPRLMAAGADLTKVFRVEVVEDEKAGTTLSLPMDNDLLEREMRRVGAALLVLDPLMSTIGASIDTHREREVREALDPLARLADRTRAVILGIAHFNKGAGTDPSSLITGSGAFKNVPRSVFGFAVDAEGGRVMTQTKNSLGRLDLPSLSYQIEGVDVPTRLGTAHVGKLIWLGEAERSVTEILGDRGDPDERAERDEAAEWLRSYLADQGGEAAFTELIKIAKAEGLSERTLRRARARAGVETERVGFPSKTIWRLQSGHSPASAAKDSNPGRSDRTVAGLAAPFDPPEPGDPMTWGVVCCGARAPAGGVCPQHEQAGAELQLRSVQPDGES
jgi:5S rRNA maturation endonuclease (ribonuclease M5)